MKEIFSTLTSKGRVTVPIEVRKHLGITIRASLAARLRIRQDLGQLPTYTPTAPPNIPPRPALLTHPADWRS